MNPLRIGPAEGNGQFAQFMAAFGHRMMYLMAVFVTAEVCYDALGQPGELTLADTAVICLYLASFYGHARYHRGRLCEPCMARTPLDPQAAVNRWKTALWLVHHRRPIVVCLIVLMVSLLGENVMRVHHAAWAASTLDGTTVLTFGVLMLAQWKHEKLEPWCPWCNWGRGGDKEVSPATPDPAVSR